MNIERAANLIRGADALLITAGAGLGVDSGLPDFRGATGFWRAYPALAQAGIQFQEVASPAAFDRDPTLAWGFYGHRLQLYRKTAPHAGFGLMIDWSRRMPHGAFVFTSNVDGHFQVAGYPADRIEEHHGSLSHLQCSVPCAHGAWSADDLVPDIDEAACRWRGALPTCPRCGSLARPNVLMFEDSRWVGDRFFEQGERLRTWLQGVQRPVVIELGAGTAVPSVRHFASRVTRSTGASLIRINPREWHVPSPKTDAAIAAGALEGLSAIARSLDRRDGRPYD